MIKSTESVQALAAHLMNELMNETENSIEHNAVLSILTTLVQLRWAQNQKDYEGLTSKD